MIQKHRTIADFVMPKELLSAGFEAAHYRSFFDYEVYKRGQVRFRGFPDEWIVEIFTTRVEIRKQQTGILKYIGWPVISNVNITHLDRVCHWSIKRHELSNGFVQMVLKCSPA